MELSAPRSLARYERLVRLGQGGLLALHRAQDGATGRSVALWTVRPLPFDPPGLDEAQAIRHPGLPAILDRGREGDLFFLAQALPEGVSLLERIEGGPLSFREGLRIACAAAGALAEAHRHGVVHGNLAPWLVLVGRETPAAVLGLGLAAAEGDPAYRSPERVRGEPLTPASDVFSLGAVLYEILTGFPPFSAPSPEALERAILFNPLPRMPVVRPGTPRAVEKLVERCLAKDPAERFADGQALADALVALAFGDPRALATPRPRRLRAFAAPALVVALAGAGLGAWYWLDTRHETPRAPEDLGVYTGWRRIAVMPPRYLGADPRRTYLVQGVVDEIVSALSANTAFDVISTLSTRVYAESTKSATAIAAELRVDGLLETTLVEEDERLRLHIRCADGRTGVYLWDETVDVPADDVFVVQDRLEGALFAAFRPVWLAAPDRIDRAASVEAYTLFLEGKHLFNLYGVGENRAAIEKFEQALEKDPTFAPAWAALARAYGNVVNVEETLDPVWLDKAESAAKKAIELAPQMPDGYFALGVNELIRYSYFGAGDRRRAESSIDDALARSPDYPDALLAKAFLLALEGIERENSALLEESLPYYERGIALQPNQPAPETNYALALAYTGQADVARARLERVLELNPDSLQPNIILAMVAFMTGDADRAVELTRVAAEKDAHRRSFHLARLAAFLAADGERAEAERLVRSLAATAAGPYEDFYLASALAGLGRDDEALERLAAWQSKMEGRQEQMGQFRWWLRNDPNFARLRAQGALEPFLARPAPTPSA